MKAGLFALAGWLALTICAMGCGTPAMGGSAPGMCGPFGDPPALFTGVVKPGCLHGELLGPWKDPNGAERYACLWVPRHAASKSRLPMVIYLHPSLFGPNTVALTGGICPNGERMAQQLAAAGVSVRDTIMDFSGKQVNQCTLSCGAREGGASTPGSDPLGFSVGLVEHGRWPRKWTPVMLDFMRAHSLDAER